eukprot:g8442.t1
MIMIIIPTDPTADKYRGSVVAAIERMKTPVQTPNRRHRGRPPRIQPEKGQLVCPACQTVWNGKMAPCRACNKKVEWEQLYQSNYEKRTRFAAFKKHKKKLRRARERKKRAAADARQRVLDARAERKRRFWEEQCKKKKMERFNKLQDDENDETKKEKETEAADSDQSDNEAASNANQAMDFKTLADSQRIAAKAKKKGMSVEEYQALSESESDSDDEAAKDPNSFKKEKTWSSIQNKLRIYANDKSEYMLGKLRDDNADAVAEAKKFLAIDYPNKTDRQALTSYYVGKHAKKTDEWFQTRDQAGMISLTDELNYLQNAMELDETFLKTKFEKD